jgi:hypothetical protein
MPATTGSDDADHDADDSRNVKPLQAETASDGGFKLLY